MMRIYSIRERPEYIPAMLESLENHWPACMPWIQKHMEQVRQTDAPLPDAYIAVEKGKVVGAVSYTHLFNTQEGGATAMEDFLADYTENQNPQYDYVSKVT